MKFSFRSLSRYRPHVLTVLLTAVSAALLVVANLSEEVQPRRLGALTRSTPPHFEFSRDETYAGQGSDEPMMAWNVSYGWPLLWRQTIEAGYLGPIPTELGNCRSVWRLACNAVAWLASVVVVGGVCEWCMRRFQPRFAWNLRSMFLGITVLAAGLGWFASVRSRADAQDPVIETIALDVKSVLLERWGPKWLETVGEDRYFRRVVGVKLNKGILRLKAQTHHESLLQLKRLPGLQYLFCDLDPALPEVLAELPKLRVLSIDAPGSESEQESSRKLLAAIGELRQLEHLRLGWMELDGGSLSHLAALENLKSLCLEEVSIIGRDVGFPPSLLSYIPALSKLQAIDINTAIDDCVLPCRAGFPCLKSLSLPFARIGNADLRQLAAISSLEELTLNDNALSPDGLEALRTLKRIRRLHVNLSHGPLSPPTHLVLDDGGILDVRESDLDWARRAWEALRRSHPQMSIDSDANALDWQEDKTVLAHFRYPFRWLPDQQRVSFCNCWHWRKERR